MLGAIGGDVIGSCWEGGQVTNRATPLFGIDAGITDDTVCVIAIAQALTEDRDVAERLRHWVRKYPGRGYGASFHTWAHDVDAGPYGSFGNGGAMRVAPVGLLAPTLDDAIDAAELTAAVTHNHPEGIRGAQAIAAGIWMARHGTRPDDIRAFIENRFGYGLRLSVAELTENDGFSLRAEDTVPEALTAALEATSYEDAMRNALQIGGDCDTIACMAGGIAEALFGIPPALATEIVSYVPREMMVVLEGLYAAADQPMPLPGTLQSPPTHSGPRAMFERLRRVFWG